MLQNWMMKFILSLLKRFITYLINLTKNGAVTLPNVIQCPMLLRISKKRVVTMLNTL